MTQDNISGWPKRITVERKIVNLLSRSLYADFPRAIREAVSNSHDADATVVKIKVDTKKGEITIEDNGNGMSVEQFDHYLRIAGTKGEGGFSEKFKRKRIGRFGVGFLAGFPFCDNLEITSKREGLEVGFTARIPTKRFVEGENVEESVSSIPIEGFNEAYSGKGHEHFTKIRMIGLTNLVDEYFRVRKEAKKHSVQSEPGMERLKWQLCETLPLDFENSYSEIAKILGNEPIGMEVWLNDLRLFRSDPGGQVLASSEQTYIKLGSLEFKYAVSTDWKIIHPIEARGIKIRLNRVGIGQRTYFDIEKEVRTFSRLNWLTGEVHIMAGLDESIGLTRDNFIWSPEYEALKDFFHRVLLKVHIQVENIAYAEKEVYETISKKGNILPNTIEEVVDRSIKQLSSSGFLIVHKKAKEIGQVHSPVVIDKKNKVATVVDDYYGVEEVNDLTNKQGIKIRYGVFGGQEKLLKPMRLAKDGIIEINRSYPVFSGKMKGDIFKRIHVLLFIAKTECNSVDEMYEFLVKKIREEFG